VPINAQISRQRSAHVLGQHRLLRPDFTRWLTSNMVESLALDEEDQFVDLGCGVGTFSIDILEQVDFNQRIIGVEPNQDLVERIPNNARIGRVSLDLLRFSDCAGAYDKVLMKDTIHYVDERRPLLSNLFERLSSDGRILLVDVHVERHPVSTAVPALNGRGLADREEIVSTLTDIGFQTSTTLLEYEHLLDKQEYFELVEARYLPNLAFWSYEEIREAASRLRSTLEDTDEIRIVDGYDFIVATRS
jgi:SAM-dependent methyltransferase